MHAARRVCHTIRFFGCDGVWSMRRGGIDAARRNGALPPVAGAVWRLFCIVRRGQDLRAKSRALRPGCAPKRACGRSPALQSTGNRQRTGNPARRTPLPGGIYASPTNEGTAYTKKNVTVWQTGTGRMHAAPTNRPGMVGEWVKQVFAADIPARERGRGFRTGARMSRTGREETVL